MNGPYRAATGENIFKEVKKTWGLYNPKWNLLRWFTTGDKIPVEQEKAYWINLQSL